MPAIRARVDHTRLPWWRRLVIRRPGVATMTATITDETMGEKVRGDCYRPLACHVRSGAALSAGCRESRTEPRLAP